MHSNHIISKVYGMNTDLLAHCTWHACVSCSCVSFEGIPNILISDVAAKGVSVTSPDSK